MSSILQQLSAFLASIVALFTPAPLGNDVAYVREVLGELPIPFWEEKPEARIIFLGDIMLDRSVRQAMEKEGEDFVFSCIKETLEDADLVVGNLEGPVTPYKSMSMGSTVGTPENFTFTFSTTTPELLVRHNIRIVNLGNNHIMNFGRDGLVHTKNWLRAGGVEWFGDPDRPEAERVLRTEIEGMQFSFVNWSDWTSDKTDHTVAQVRAEAESGRVVVVYTHWGEEYVPATPRMKQLARSFVDAGASIVIGSHPHVIQEHEEYAGAHIYYSLGNFIFDQYWNDEVRTGLILRVTFDAEGVVSVEEKKVRLERDRRTCPVEQPVVGA